MKIVLAGIVARHPFGGVAWCALMYLLGFRALGHEVFYVEDTGECVYDPVRNTISEDPAYGLAHLHDTLAPHGLGDRWAFVNYDGRYHGASRARVVEACRDADLFVNLSGGSWFWRDEYARVPRKVFIDSDPAFTQMSLVMRERSLHEFFERFDTLFTFGANVGRPGCTIPDAGFTWHHTWQPVVLDQWTDAGAPRDRRFTTVMTWTIKSFTDIGGNKDQEFLKVIGLPARVGPRFQLAVNGPHDLLRAHLDRRGFTDIEIIKLGGEAPASSPPGSLIERAAVAASITTWQKEPVMLPWFAGSGPMYSMSTLLGIPVCFAGATWHPDMRAHSPNENIFLDDYFDSMRFTAALIDHFAQAAV